VSFLRGVVPTARMDPWSLVLASDCEVLFGFCVWHETLGGRSWTRSSPLVELDAVRGRAATMSGRIYELGRQIEICDLPDDESRYTFALLVGPASSHRSTDDDDVRWWLGALKVARWLEIDPPERGETEAILRFLDAHRVAYLAKRRAAMLR
jgi:hypothetical protein